MEYNSPIWNPPYYPMCAILFPLHNFSWPGFYFPDVTAEDKYYNGSILEEEYEKKLMVSDLIKLKSYLCHWIFEE